MLYDADAFRAFMEIISMVALPGDVMARPGFSEHIANRGRPRALRDAWPVPRRPAELTGLSRMETAFVLGGGGVLGAYEVGMLRALAEAGIVPDLVVGTVLRADLAHRGDRGAVHVPRPMGRQRVRRAAAHRAVPGPPLRDHEVVPRRLYRSATKTFRVQVIVDEPELTPAEQAARLARPVIVLSRHAGLATRSCWCASCSVCTGAARGWS